MESGVEGIENRPGGRPIDAQGRILSRGELIGNTIDGYHQIRENESSGYSIATALIRASATRRTAAEIPVGSVVGLGVSRGMSLLVGPAKRASLHLLGILSGRFSRSPSRRSIPHE